MIGTGFRGPRIHQGVTIAVAVVLLALGVSPTQSSLDRGAFAQQATPRAATTVPLHELASGEGSLPATSSEVVWLVRRGAVSGDQRAEASAFPLGFALAQRGALDILGEDGARISALDPGQAAFLPTGMAGAFASVTGDLALYVQIALLPASAVPAALPPETLVSEPFTAPDAAFLTLELVRGIVNPGRETTVPAPELPALVLATNNALRIEPAGGEPVDVPRDDIVLLADAATIRNDGQQLLTFVAARIVPHPADDAATATGRDTAPVLQPLDPAIDEAWRRHGCHLNPGHAACLTVGMAAECDTTPNDPGCRIDGDGDRCTDVAEVRAGFDPFDPADCIGSGQGAPAVNCLFLTEDIACDGSRGAPEEDDCVAAREIRLRRNPSSFFGCETLDEHPPDACLLVARDPRCDGFAPHGG